MGEFLPDVHGAGRWPVPGRRSLLLAATGLAVTALSACALQPPAAPAPGPVPAGPSPDPAPGVAAVGNLPDGPAAPPDPPSKSQIVAEFSGRKPVEWGLAVTGVVNRTSSPHAALTFDACGGPGGSGFDQKMLQTLRRLNVPATLFVNGRWIKANPGLVAELASDPLFELANHGFKHAPLSVTGRAAYGITGTSDVADVFDEIMGNQAVMEQMTGKAPRFFRPGTAFYDDVAAAVTRALGLTPVNFTVNGDGGATFPARVVATEVGKVRGGDVVISHINQPAGGTAEGYARALPGLLDRGVTFARLGDALSL
ncbi:polysaccharide deacetylase family protein [bacterium RCC_150]